MTTSVLVMESPVGPIRITADDDAVIEAIFIADAVPTAPDVEVTPVLAAARDQFLGYFEGDLREFDLPLAMRGTAFQRRVWSELARIPFGTTTSYGQIAARLGLPMGASRAVGTANGANPVAIVVPCHRVIGSNGKLIGYAGGLDRKRFLLQHESARTSQGALFA
jgi:methylated-DNA-[protein]-cysteine S-methyltransferase